MNRARERFVLEDGDVEVGSTEAADLAEAVGVFVVLSDDLEVGKASDWSDAGTDGSWWWSRLDLALTIRRVAAGRVAALADIGADIAIQHAAGAKAARKPVSEPRRDREVKFVEYFPPSPSPRPDRHGHTDRMIALCRSFPSLDREDLPEPWDARTFEAWSRGAWATSGSRCASQFVLAVWSGKSYDTDDRITTLAAVEDDEGTWPMWDKRETSTRRATAPAGTRTGAIRPLWTMGAFDAIRAMGSWDERHRVAFLAWCAAPWWP